MFGKSLEIISELKLNNNKEWYLIKSAKKRRLSGLAYSVNVDSNEAQ
jgi:hypothetical protein